MQSCIPFPTDFPPDQVPVALVSLLYGEKQDIRMDRLLNDTGNLPKGVVSYYVHTKLPCMEKMRNLGISFPGNFAFEGKYLQF